jgi:hypothetical protein
MQRRKKKKENERENLFQVKRKKCVQKEFDRADIVRDVWLSKWNYFLVARHRTTIAD